MNNDDSTARNSKFLSQRLEDLTQRRSLNSIDSTSSKSLKRSRNVDETENGRAKEVVRMVHDELLFSYEPSPPPPPPLPPTATIITTPSAALPSPTPTEPFNDSLDITPDDFDLIVNGNCKILNKLRGKLVAPFLIHDPRIGEDYHPTSKRQSSRYGYIYVYTIYWHTLQGFFGDCDYGLSVTVSTFKFNAHAHSRHKASINADEFARSNDITTSNRILFAYYTQCHCGSYIERRQLNTKKLCRATVNRGWVLSQMQVTECSESLNMYSELNGFMNLQTIGNKQ